MFDIKAYLENVFQSNITWFSERVSTCELKLTVSRSHILSYNDIVNCINTINHENRTQIIITNPDEDTLYISDSDMKCEQEYNRYFSCAEPEDDFELKIIIDKEIVDDKFVIYNYQSFTDDLLDNSLSELMSVFSNLLKDRESIVFHVLDESIFWCTKTMMFTGNPDTCFSESMKRISRIETCKQASFFQSTGNMELIPDDFDIINNIKDNPYASLFNKIRTILSLCYFSSSATIDRDSMKCIINGQRSISFNYSLSDIYNNKTLYDIYTWVFTEGNYVDKAIIARNIISLHCKYCSILDIDSSIFISITSSYGIYLKENVSQYLDAKTKVSEFISEIGSKMTANAFELLNDFKRNILAIFSFLLTVILVNIVSEHPLENFLTREITMLLELILFGSLVYFVISLIQSYAAFKRIQKSYSSLKKNYEGVFSPDEIDDIFNNDNLYLDSEKLVKRNMKIFSAIWVIFIIIAFLTIEFTSPNPIIRPLLIEPIEELKKVLFCILIKLQHVSY